MPAVTARRSKDTRSGTKVEEIELAVLRQIIDRGREEPLSEEDGAKLLAAFTTLAFLTEEIRTKGTTIARLRKLLFGSKSEKRKHVLPKDAGSGNEQEQDADADADADSDSDASGTEPAQDSDPREAEKSDEKKPPRRKGRSHGRHPASAYVGALKIEVPHGELQHKDRCPCCDKGRVYLQQEPEKLVRIVGVGPLKATCYELARLRCNACGKPFTAAPPPGVGTEKYDETAIAMIALLRYGCGLPHNRIETLCKGLGIPMPSSTQWELVAAAATKLEPAWNALVHRAAHGEVLYIDDTNARILELDQELRKALAEGKRSGVFTSGIISTTLGKKIALFFTGRRHAGENLAEVLSQRDPKLGPPIQMGDASSRNTSFDHGTLVAACLTHARRHFVDVVDSFPDEVAHVLEELGEVYKNDQKSREHYHSAKERLAFHQEHSGPVMKRLETWLEQQLEERKVEPNSGLGGAIQYIQNHWEKLTLFLREPGAPLDNNLCERGLKKAILHRKNSLFYKTENGAHVGDLFLSLIHTCELNRVEPFEYLATLQRYHKAVAAAPAEWLPWCYQEALDALRQD